MALHKDHRVLEVSSLVTGDLSYVLGIAVSI